MYQSDHWAYCACLINVLQGLYSACYKYVEEDLKNIVNQQAINLDQRSSRTYRVMCGEADVRLRRAHTYALTFIYDLCLKVILKC